MISRISLMAYSALGLICPIGSSGLLDCADHDGGEGRPASGRSSASMMSFGL